MHRTRISFFRFLTCSLAVVVVVVVLVQDLRPAAASAGDVRVLYLFSPSSSEQVARFAQLQRRAQGASHVELIGLSREDPIPEGIRAISVVRFLASGAPDAASRRWVAERLRARGDALRVERPDSVYSSDEDDRSIEAIADRAGVALVTTDIDFSTWGKVKDLFR